jgi:hypothetical protein
MTGLLRTRTVAAVLCLATLSLSARAQVPAPDTTEWENEALKLRLFYPSELEKSDTSQVLNGHSSPFNSSGATDPKLAEEMNCLRAILYLNLPPSGASQPAAVNGFILLAELDVNCLTEEQQNKTNLLPEVAEIVNRLPYLDMKPMAKPATYTIGLQKVHMAAAQGHYQTAPAPAPLYAMGISTNWNSHLLVWYFGSNNVDTLNRITKTTVRFGRDQAAPLYPLSIGNATR